LEIEQSLPIQPINEVTETFRSRLLLIFLKNDVFRPAFLPWFVGSFGEEVGAVVANKGVVYNKSCVLYFDSYHLSVWVSARLLIFCE